jgi:uncharacterized protein (DUF1015 family)
MSLVHPFRALTYDFRVAGSPETLLCPPYDIIPDAQIWENKSPYNMIFLEKPTGENAYEAAAQRLREWKQKGVLHVQDKPAYYLYEMTFDSIHTLTGLFSLVELSEYSEKRILPHEQTLSGPKVDRYALMKTTKCQFSPLYMLYPDPERIVAGVIQTAKTREPILAITGDDGIVHTLRVIDDAQEIETITNALSSVSLYIADGHHRYETSLQLYKDSGGTVPNTVLTMLTDLEDPAIEVLPTHRLLPSLEEGVSLEGVLKQLETEFVLESAAPLGPNTFRLLTSQGEWNVRLKDKSYQGLEVSLLHERILDPIFHLDPEKVRAGGLVYSRSETEARESVATGKSTVVFLLRPTPVSHIRKVADAGGFMPQKSTYFYPKPLSGLVIHDFSV